MLGMHDKWLFFFGDMTLRQVYGEFAGLAHDGQASGASPTAILPLQEVTQLLAP